MSFSSRNSHDGQGPRLSDPTRPSTNARRERSMSVDSDAGGLIEKVRNRTAVLAVWTINDQKKLISLNSLYNRTLEFHHNVHTKESPLMLLNQTVSAATTPSEQHRMHDFTHSSIIAKVISFSSDKSKRLLQTFNYPQFTTFCRDTLSISVAETESRKKNLPQENEGNNGSSASSSAPQINTNEVHNDPCYWIHVEDICAIDTIYQTINMHDLVYSGFHDLRGNSTIVPCGKELLLSNIICHLEDDSTFHMYKVYMYMKGNIFITYEAEVFPLLSPSDMDKNDLTMLTSSFVPPEIGLDGKTLPTPIAAPTETTSGKTKNPLVTSAISPKERESNTNITSTVVTGNTQSITYKVMQYFFKNMIKLKKNVLELGIFYLMYEISLHLLTFYDGSIEYLSSSLSYFNRIVHLNLLHRERLTMKIKIHMLSAGISLLRKSIEGCVETIARLSFRDIDLVDEHYRNNSLNESTTTDSVFSVHYAATPMASSSSSSQGRGNRHTNNGGNHSHGKGHDITASLKDVHLLYLLDMNDAYVFKRNCLQKQQEEIKRVETELDATIALRTTNTNTILSLIATTFLPLSFFAGVFGMNFTVDGGYTISLLNQNYGPDVFIGLCLCKSLVIFFFLV
jgi:hypothetical protein